MSSNDTDRYGLDLSEPLDWATLVDRAAETGCVDEMLDLQAIFTIEDTDRLFRELSASAAPPADFPALVTATLALGARRQA